MNLKKHIGLRVKAARKEKGWTQEHLSSRLNKAVETVSHIERGASYTSLETLEAIAKLLGKPIIYFFDGAELSQTLKSTEAATQLKAKLLIEKLSARQLQPIIAMLEATVQQ